MLNRRDFISKTATLSAVGLLFSAELFAKSPLLEKIGIQFFSLPKLLEKDFPGTLAMLSKMGYKEVELYGPYSFSTASARQRWDAVTPSLGFKGSGYFGHSGAEVKNMLQSNGLTVPSMHTDLDTLQTGMDKLAEAAQLLGAEYVILPSIPEEKRKTLDDYKNMADAFNKIGEAAKKGGVKFAYHNHGYGLKEMNGQIPLKLILDGTDPSLVFFEMDLYWTTAGGADPIALLEDYKTRYHLMHVKDMSKKVQFSGDGGDSKQWIELFPYMTTAGNGVLDLKTILTKAKATGVKHFIVEQDMVAEPEIALKKSYDYLASLK
ncbi:sugar phosphate isomerase/epimerase [Panacibacter ginsenosidivorans]|uniref:Sugar phosphate isomerase/epimerase n=1 Tax=Panacibacter ginsenosidivorans TaxID=1813871 RepID=A0A5B8V4W8_9BACT|nr:sugar phosphate isomerase/epimerase [Panacibacter ginsenosidivorans]QEC66239.1 sugar phosphate isomerase/epimerase [Panacibacter ginsenosidivorans]